MSDEEFRAFSRHRLQVSLKFNSLKEEDISRNASSRNYLRGVIFSCSNKAFGIQRFLKTSLLKGLNLSIFTNSFFFRRYWFGDTDFDMASLQNPFPRNISPNITFTETEIMFI